VGDVVTLIGRDAAGQVSACEVAQKAGISHYELLTRLNLLIEIPPRIAACCRAVMPLAHLQPPPLCKYLQAMSQWGKQRQAGTKVARVCNPVLFIIVWPDVAISSRSIFSPSYGLSWLGILFRSSVSGRESRGPPWQHARRSWTRSSGTRPVGRFPLLLSRFDGPVKLDSNPAS
jgi:hypothetical protein